MSSRNRRVSASVLAVVFTLLSFVALTRAFRNSEHPATAPTPTPVDRGIFSEVGGWIAYGDAYDPGTEGIWAVDPTGPGDPKDQIQLRAEQGMPLAWSSDGSKLLIQGYASGTQLPGRLFILNADGTETYLTTIEGPILPGGFFRGGSFSPDGSHVIYAERGSIYVVDTPGGTPRILFTAGRRWSPGCGCSFRHPWVFNPTYSPDGTQIAYSDGIGDNSHQLQVMNADGSGTHVIVAEQQGHTMHNVSWSPDGERLAFGLGRSSGIYIVGADGSGLTLVIPDATYPYWSSDGSRISYQLPGAFGTLEIADADGTRVVEFGYGGSGPWNPLVQPESGVVEAPARSEGLIRTSLLVLMMALLALLLGAALIRRRVRSERRERATRSV